MQPTNHLSPANQLLTDSVDYVASRVRIAREAHNHDDFSAAFLAGAEQFFVYLKQFAERVEEVIDKNKCSVFERGQLDGINWAVDAMKTMLGKD